MCAKPVSSEMWNHLARHPNDFVRYRTTGRLPNTINPDSPLIRLLETLGPRDRLAIKGVQIHKLGYGTGQVWQNAEQLYNWLKPSNEIIGSYPAGSWQDKRFNHRLTLQDLKDNSKDFPAHLERLLSRKGSDPSP